MSALQRTSQTEIPQLHQKPPAFEFHEDVAWFDVVMYYTLRMDVFQS